MGLGKTIQAIAVALYFKEDWPLLIVAPSSLLLNWNRELCEFLPEELSRNIKVISRSKDIASADLKSPTNIVIISYSLTKHIAKLGPSKIYSFTTNQLYSTKFFISSF